MTTVRTVLSTRTVSVEFTFTRLWSKAKEHTNTVGRLEEQFGLLVATVVIRLKSPTVTRVRTTIVSKNIGCRSGNIIPRQTCGTSVLLTRVVWTTDRLILCRLVRNTVTTKFEVR